MEERIRILDEEFVLHYSGALFWEARGMLMISDVHLGKVSHFRKHGAAIPNQAIYGNFELLDKVVECFRPRKIIFLGDLFHSFLNGEWDLFENWVHRTGPEITLVSGNHDIISPLRYEAIGVDVVDELEIGSFLMTHHPELRNGRFNFAGHIHPAIKLKGPGRQRLRLPCFFQSKHQLILPAFGAFTGSHALEPGKTDQVYAIAEEQVIKIG